MAHNAHLAKQALGPAFSLFRLSAFARCVGALALVACLWAAVFWALH